MPDYPDLATLVGRVVRDPATKTTSKGDIVEFKVSQQLQYGKGDGDFGKSRLVTVAVWNEQLAEKVLDEVVKGQTVACEGNMKKADDQYGDFSAFRVGPVAWIAKNGSRAAGKASPDEF